MDILDEIDAELTEKKSKWNYTPMREKSETDAIIDDLLREFSNESTAPRKTSPPRYREAEASLNEEAAERMEYERAVASDKPNFDIPADEADEIIPQDLGESEFDEYDEYGEYSEYPDEQECSDEEYDEYPDEEYTEDYPGEEYDDEGYEAYEGSGNYGGKSGKDFENFMDSENDGEKGDMPRYWFSGLIKTILKIAVVAGVLILLILGGVKAYDMLKEKYGFGEAVVQTNPLKKELQKVVTPLVAVELEDFENKSELESEDYINVAVWEYVINGGLDEFTDEETGESRLPAQEMETAVERLFGEVELEHCSAGVGRIEIEYDKKNKEYIIPEDAKLYSYNPNVTDIADTDPVYTVYVNCFSSPAWENEDSKPDKRVMITLEKTDDYYNIISQKTIPVE